jgi:isopentenyl diphosphate isomerase/L-lactate dehydrogenase-like FMN-dependent dehydrogenase
MMVSPPERDLSIDLFGKHLPSPIFMCPIGLIGLCAPDFQGDVAAARRRRKPVCRSRCPRSRRPDGGRHQARR